MFEMDVVVTVGIVSPDTPMNVAINPPQRRAVVQVQVVSAAHVEDATNDAIAN
jgi:hypothetical protein